MASSVDSDQTAALEMFCYWLIVLVLRVILVTDFLHHHIDQICLLYAISVRFVNVFHGCGSPLGPGCSKLTMLLVNVTLKFQTLIFQIR